jgi:hypothetical protein
MDEPSPQRNDSVDGEGIETMETGRDSSSEAAAGKVPHTDARSHEIFMSINTGQN